MENTTVWRKNTTKLKNSSRNTNQGKNNYKKAERYLSRNITLGKKNYIIIKLEILI